MALPLIAAFASACGGVSDDAPDDVGTISDADRIFVGGGPGTGGPVIPPINRPPAVTIADVSRLQPGWVRARLTWTGDVPNPRAMVAVACTVAGRESSLDITTLFASRSDRQAIVDIKTSTSWLIDNRNAEPCHVTTVAGFVSGAAVPSGSATRPLDFAMDAPVMYRGPEQIAGLPVTDTVLPLNVPASTRKWAAYPPRQFAVRTRAGATSFIEVEALPTRGTVGVRGVKTYNADGSRGLDFNGGAEMFPGWGIDVERLGVTKTTSGAEISHTGVTVFPSGSWTASMMNDASRKVLPAPPLFSDAEYMAGVLDNHGIPHDLGGAYDLDVVYDAASASLRAVNGATLAALDLGAPIASTPTVTAAPPIPPSPPIIFIADSTPPAVAASTVNRCDIAGSGTSFKITAPVTACTGASKKSGFRCPTMGDPLKPEALPSPPMRAGEVSLYRNISPMLDSRGNVLYGDCGTQAYAQDDETLLNTYLNDVMPKRALVVNGQPVAVNEAPIGLSTAANHWSRYTMIGTEGDMDNGVATTPRADEDGLDRPQFLDGFWTAREQYYWDWRDGMRPYDAKRFDDCYNSWTSGFCMAQGNPRPGIYRNYSSMIGSGRLDALRDGVFSLGNTYNPLTRTTIQTWPPTDRAKALRDTMSYVGGGLPVRMSFKAGNAGTTDSTGAFFNAFSGNAWYLPPEIAACDPGVLWNTLAPSGGHWVNIVGYSLAGSLTAPDPVNSYFIIQNNWGAGAGREGFYAMSFAYFSFIAEELFVYQLNRTCPSQACARH